MTFRNSGVVGIGDSRSWMQDNLYFHKVFFTTQRGFVIEMLSRDIICSVVYSETDSFWHRTPGYEVSSVWSLIILRRQFTGSCSGYYTKDMWLSGGRGIVLICAFAIGKWQYFDICAWATWGFLVKIAVFSRIQNRSLDEKNNNPAWI